MTEIVEVIRRCTFCGTEHVVHLDRPRHDRWQGGEHIQRVFPELNADQREILISGTCPACWDKYMGGGE